MIAPTSPAKITAIEMTSGCTTPLAMVAATAVPKMPKAMKLKNAAQTTAWNGLSTRVDTIVAIELAASWKPLTKSKRERGRDHDDDHGDVLQGGQPCLSAMLVMTSAVCSKAFSACSSDSTMSFHFSTVKALYEPENSSAVVRR